MIRLMPFALIVALSTGAAGAGEVNSPFLSQGLKRANPIVPAPDPLREYVAPQFTPPDPRDRAVALPGHRQRKLLPQDGDIRLRRQKGEIVEVPQPRRSNGYYGLEAPLRPPED